MVGHKPISENDLAKLTFKPGKFKIIKTTKLYPLNKNINIEHIKVNNNTIMEVNSGNVPQDSNNASTQNPLLNQVEPGNGNCSGSSEGTLLESLQINVPVRNKFQVLERPEAMETITSDENPPTTSKKTGEKPKNVKEARPPPIVLHSKVKNHTMFFNNMKKEIHNGFHVKNCKNTTIINVHDVAEYRKHLIFLEESKIKFHTYSEKKNKTHAFILKGIDSEPEVEDIKNDLQINCKIPVENVYKLRNTTRGMYLIITDNSVFLKHLKAKVPYVCYTKVSWERQRNRNPVLQCRRCQRWGHATANCRADPVCTKCSLDHWTKECSIVDKDKTDTHTFIKCANCKGDHVAFSKECPQYKKRIEQIEQRKEQIYNIGRKAAYPPINKTNYVPAPLPQINAWTNIGRAVPHLGQELHDSVSRPRSTNTEEQNPQINFNTLVSEFTELNQLLNVEHMVNLIRELNKQLRTCQTDLEKFLKFNNFCQLNFTADSGRSKQCIP